MVDSERGRKEGNVLFNDALNTFYLRHMVKNHSDNDRQGKTYHNLCYTSRVALAGMKVN